MADDAEQNSATEEKSNGGANSVADNTEETNLQPESKLKDGQVKLRPGVAPIKAQWVCFDNKINCTTIARGPVGLESLV